MTSGEDRYKVWRVLGEAPIGFKCNICGSEAKWVVENSFTKEKLVVCDSCLSRLEASSLEDACKSILRHLETVWSYSGDVFYELRIIHDVRAYPVWFRKPAEAAGWVKTNWSRLRLWEKNVFYGVPPREVFSQDELDENGLPKAGGKKNNVKRALWLFCDLDFKKTVEEVEAEVKKTVEARGYHIVREDGGFEGYFKDGNKVVWVRKPALREFLAQLGEMLKPLGVAPTLIVDSGYGYHVYFKLNREIDAVRWEDLQKKLIDYLGGDPQSKDAARVLRLAGTYNTRYKPYVRPCLIVYEDLNSTVDPEKLAGLLEGATARGAEELPKKRGAKRLSEDQVKRIVRLLEPFYVPTHRDAIVYSLLGMFIKAGVDYDSAKRCVELLATTQNDEEIRARLYLVDYHYKGRADLVGLEKLKGVTGLREELEKVLREEGLSEEEVVRRVSETLAELGTILGERHSPGVAWIERKGGFIRKWVAVGRDGIYLFRRLTSEDEPIVQLVSNATVRKAKAVKILGLDLRNLYTVDIGGEKVTGTTDEVVAFIERYYGLEGGARYALARLIEHMADEEEELFYSPGPWVIDGRIVFAREPGYTPEWKHYVVWSLPDDDIPEELMRKALETVKKLVEAYRDPSKPSLVLSYGAVSPVMHYIKRMLNIAPHLLMHGLEDTGKSIILEMIKLIFNINWDDTFPGSDYQARRCLATSTLPAIIDELGSVIEGYAEGRKDPTGAINVMHRAATQEMLREAGGYGYGGTFLGIRSIIAATNSDISIVPWQLDKFILVTISTREGIDVDKAKGSTPRTMDPEVKKALPYVGRELLKELEKLLPEFEEAKRLPRDEIRRKLIEVGWKAWGNLYRRYGLEPFPKPTEPETEVEKASLREQYGDVFLSYLAKCRAVAAEGRDYGSYPKLLTYREELLKDKEALYSLEENLAIQVVKQEGDTPTMELICKTSFLSRFIEWAHDEYGLPKMGWKRLAELLNIHITSRAIGGKTLKNILAKKLE